MIDLPKFNEKEIPSKIKKKLIEKIRKFRKLKDLRMNLINLLQKETLNEYEISKIENIINEIRGLYPIREEIFENLKTFENFYHKNIMWFEYKINAEKHDFPKHLAKKLKKVMKTEKTVRIGKTKWKEIHKGRDLERQEEQEYSTLELINDLIDDLQKQPELLAKIFPERLQKYTRRDLSRIWGYSKEHIQNIVYKISSGVSPHYEFKAEKLSLLKEKIVDKLGVKAVNAIKIIEIYEETNMPTLEFIEQVRKELGRVTASIMVTFGELSTIFGLAKGFISDVLTRYDQDYRLDQEILNNLKQNIKVDKLSFKNILNFIKKFERLNPDIPLYSRQQFTITNVNAFQDISSNIEAAYWFGFLSADGWLSKTSHEIEFRQAVKDEESVQKFADFVGFNRSRISPSRQIKKVNGEIKIYESKVIRFSAKPMADRLKDLGLFGSKSSRKNVPDFVKKAIKLAKDEAREKNFHWSETKHGKIAHAWLLGFYDGDGTHGGGYHAIVLAASKDLLEEIKDLFNSPNHVLTQIEPGEEVLIFGELFISIGYYRLSLGPKVFRGMLNSYRESMQRKRP